MPPLCGPAPCYGPAPRWQQGGLSSRDIFPALLSHFDEAGWNVLGYHVPISEHRAWLVDWAWPTLGAAWTDLACWVLRALMASGGDQARYSKHGPVPGRL